MLRNSPSNEIRIPELEGVLSRAGITLEDAGTGVNLNKVLATAMAQSGFTVRRGEVTTLIISQDAEYREAAARKFRERGTIEVPEHIAAIAAFLAASDFEPPVDRKTGEPVEMSAVAEMLHAEGLSAPAELVREGN